jgi:hypothetical protein
MPITPPWGGLSQVEEWGWPSGYDSWKWIMNAISLLNRFLIPAIVCLVIIFDGLLKGAILVPGKRSAGPRWIRVNCYNAPVVFWAMIVAYAFPIVMYFLLLLKVLR